MSCHRSNHHPFHSHHPCCCWSSSSPPPCCCCCCFISIPNPAVQDATPTAASDPLLQAIAAHLLQSTAAAAPQHAHHLRNPQYPQPQFAHHHYQQQQQQKQKHQHQQQPPEAQSLIQSLLRRIAALETAIPHLSSPPPPPAAVTPVAPPRNTQPSPRRTTSTPRVSIRDLAARTIQAHFRRYLVRRSRTLRHLKRLASVRSHVAAIKSSLADEARFCPKGLSQKATDLLLQLDSIQSADPMIREGKGSINRELVRLLEFADEVSVKRQEFYMESMETPHGDTDRTKKPVPEPEELAGVSTVSDGVEEELDTRSLKARASASKTAKRVGFAVNGNGTRVSTAAEALFTDEGTAGFGAGFARVSEDGAEEPSWAGGRGGGGSHRSSDEVESPRSGQKAGIHPVMNGSPNGPKGTHLVGLSAPLPPKMEPRGADPRKKNVLTVT